MIRPAPFLALALFVLPAPLLAQAPCLPLGGEIALCGDGTPWAGAQPVPITGDDGVVAYELPPLYLEASLEWLDAGDARTPEAALALMQDMLREEAAADGGPAPVRTLRDTVATGHASVALDVYTEVFDGQDYPLAVLLVADGGGWLTLFLSGDEPMPAATFEAEARALAGLLRPVPEG